jgi:hypothetical protein
MTSPPWAGGAFPAKITTRPEKGLGGLVNDPSNPPLSVPSKRPAWFAGTPALELDCRTEGSDGIAALRTVMQEAHRLLPGQILTIRIGFEPAFLCRALASRGFIHWPEPTGGGDWMIYFLRRLKPRQPNG